MKSRILFTTNPHPGDVARFQAEATALIKSKLEVEFNLDPRQPMSVGQLAAVCRGLELDAHERAQIKLPTGEVLSLMAISAREPGKEWVYLGNELRLGGAIVAQRLRSPEASQAFKAAKTSEARFEKAANLFLANWRNEAIVDRETARRTVTMSFPSDMTAGIAYRLSWYTREHAVAGRPGHVDLRPALGQICEALDQADAEAKAKADAEVAAKAEALAVVQVGDATVAELRAQAKVLGITGYSKLKKQELIDAIAAVAAPEPSEVLVTAEEMKAVAVALNTLQLDGGQRRLRDALKAAGVPVPVVEGATAGSWLERAVATAKRCRAAPAVDTLEEAVMVLEHDEADEAVIVTG